MVNIYEKVPKTIDNEYGIKEIKDENPFLNGPCIISILPVTIFLKDVNGMLRQVANLVNPNIDTNYDPDRRLLGITFGEYNEKHKQFDRLSVSDEEMDTFVKKYIYPLCTDYNGEKIDVLKAMKNFRNLTFFTYCNGSKHYNMIERRTKKMMESLGYADSDIGMILSQICLASVSGHFIRNVGTSALTFHFGDVNDLDYEHDSKVIDGIKNIGSGYINYETLIGFAVDNDGEHSLKKHLSNNPELSTKIFRFLNASLDNAILNKESDEFIPMTYEKMEKALNSDSRSL